jgi:hypothetical protein
MDFPATDSKLLNETASRNRRLNDRYNCCMSERLSAFGELVQVRIRLKQLTRRISEGHRVDHEVFLRMLRDEHEALKAAEIRQSQ